MQAPVSKQGVGGWNAVDWIAWGVIWALDRGRGEGAASGRHIYSVSAFGLLLISKETGYLCNFGTGLHFRVNWEGRVEGFEGLGGWEELVFTFFEKDGIDYGTFWEGSLSQTRSIFGLSR